MGSDIQAALNHANGERDVSHVIEELLTGHKQLWLEEQDGEFIGTVVTQVIETPNKKICEITYLAGNGMINHLGDIKEIEKWAVYNGCTDIHVIGRKGWERALKDQGYTQRYVTIGKTL